MREMLGDSRDLFADRLVDIERVGSGKLHYDDEDAGLVVDVRTRGVLQGPELYSGNVFQWHCGAAVSRRADNEGGELLCVLETAELDVLELKFVGELCGWFADSARGWLSM